MDAEMKLLVVAGARPNFMKIAPVLWAAERRGMRPTLVHTGQHYDDGMSAAFFRDLAIPEPDHYLACGGAAHHRPEGWDGAAGERIVAALLDSPAARMNQQAATE